MNCQNQKENCSEMRGCPRRCITRRSCLCIAVGFLAVLALFALGLILGAVYYETILPVLASVIAFAAALAAVVIALALYCLCRRND